MKFAINGVIDEAISDSFSESLEALQKMEEKLSELKTIYSNASFMDAETLSMMKNAIDCCEKRYLENVEISKTTFELLLKSGFVIVESK